MMTAIQKIVRLVNLVIGRFSEVEGMSMAAALAYYTLFAMPPMLFILVNTVSLGMSTYYEGDVAKEKARNFLQVQVSELIGNARAGEEVGRIIERTALQSGVWWRVSLSMAAVLVGATGLVHALQSSLNRIWGVRVEPGMLSLQFLWKRIFSLGMLLSFGLLLVISFIISTIIDAAGTQVSEYMAVPAMVPLIANFLTNALVTWIFFIMVFKIMPDSFVSWRAAIYGGSLTLVLFIIGRWVLAFYLSVSDPGEQLGSAAAALLVIIIWVYYSYAILLVGAAYTYTLQPGKTAPEPGAERVETVVVETDHGPNQEQTS